MLRDVARSVGELAEDQHLPSGELLRLQKPDQLLELVVVLRLELPRLLEEADDLVEVEERLVEDLLDLVFVAIEPHDLVEQLLRARHLRRGPRRGHPRGSGSVAAA